MAGAHDNLGCCGLLECLCGLLQVFLDPPRYSQVETTRSPCDVATSSAPSVARERRYDYRVHGLSPSPVARSSPDLRSRYSQAATSRDVSTSSSGTTVAARGLRSDGRVGNPSPVAWNSPDLRSRYPQAATTTSSSSRDVSGNHYPTVARNSTAQQNGMAGGIEDDDDDDDCVIVAEKGEVACRDFPHSRHLCSNMPFGTTSHNKHCTMCYCFVCDAPAPCSYWGKGLSVDDHCHATDKETKWKTLREAFKQRSNGSGISNGQSAQISHRLALTASALRAHSAAGAARGTSNAHTAQISHPVAPTASAPRAQPAAGAGRGTSNAYTAQISRPLALPGSVPRATSAARVQSGTGNGHSAQVTHLVESTGSGARAHPAAGAGRGTSNAHTAQISHPVTPTVSAARAQPTGGAGREPTVGATRAYSAAIFGRGTSNATTSQTTRSAEQTVSAPRVYPGARVGRDSSNAHSAPEGTTVYVGNLPVRIDNETLKLTFQHAGVVLFSKVIYDRETSQSRGFAYVTMNTVQEAETVVRMYNGSMVYGRPLTVNITAPRGSPRVDTARSLSVSPFKIFICNLPTQVDRPRLEELFSKHGTVVDARVIYERQGEDCCSRGFGFVTMATEEESNSAIRGLNKQVLEGHALKVKVARDMWPQQGRLSPSNQTPLQNSTSQNQNTHTSVRASLSAAPTASATTGRSGTSNADIAEVTHRLEF
ncbi:uncharacterized protein LOC124707089 isoform X2 [Lolium rigidum]|uniref:uncharacterized protein LOC124707089 isoform X2 n=1 Tax=Lolium rigidum TaxID=89674 RepID=UPI001F5D7CB9|nr:uncharacterized protein LOC124707089 isoform X2 [Lolium rigidum]